MEAIFDAMTDGVVVYGPAGEVLRMNATYRRLLALDEAELLRPIHSRGHAITPRQPTGEPLPEAEWPATRIRRGEVLTGPHSIDVLVRSHNGHDLLLNCAGAPILDAHGQLTASVMVIHDVTEVRRATNLIAERAQELEATFQAMTDAVIVIDALGTILRRNAAAERLYAQATSSDFASRPISERVRDFALYTAEGEPLADDEWPAMRVLRGETLDNEAMADVFYHTQDGQPVWLNASGVPLRDATGTVIGGVIVYRDVTARHLLEQRTQEVLDALIAMAETLVELPSETETSAALSAQARKYPVAHRLANLTRRVLGCGRVGIIAVDLETGSQRAIAVVGLSPEQERQWWAEQEARQARSGAGAQPEEVARLLAGELFHLDMTQPPYDHLPNPYGITSVLVAPMRVGAQLVGILSLDHSGAHHTFTHEELRLTEAVAQLGALVIERDRLVRQRARVRADLLAAEEASRRMGAFLSIASHELRTPVTTILPTIQVLIQRAERAAAHPADPTTEAARLRAEIAILRRTERQVTRLVRLLDDLVDAVRVREDQLDLRLASCDLCAIVREIVEEQQAAHPDRIQLVSTPEPAPLLVRADADRLGQVLTNYLTNALKYSVATAPVEVRLAHAEGRATVTVRDHGPGIPPEEREHIWELFHRVPGIEVRSGSGIGLGLGLHISRNLIERHGGAVGVESTIGQGSTFWFTLPLAE
jgi:signal transduction histidine kinase